MSLRRPRTRAAIEGERFPAAVHPLLRGNGCEPPGPCLLHGVQNDGGQKDPPVETACQHLAITEQGVTLPFGEKPLFS